MRRELECCCVEWQSWNSSSSVILGKVFLFFFLPRSALALGRLFFFWLQKPDPALRANATPIGRIPAKIWGQNFRKAERSQKENLCRSNSTTLACQFSNRIVIFFLRALLRNFPIGLSGRICQCDITEIELKSVPSTRLSFTRLRVVYDRCTADKTVEAGIFHHCQYPYRCDSHWNLHTSPLETLPARHITFTYDSLVLNESPATHSV